MNINLVKTTIDDLKCPSTDWKYHAKNLSNYSDEKYDNFLLETIANRISVQGSLKSYEGKDLVSCVLAKKKGDTSWDFVYNSVNEAAIYWKIKAIVKWIRKLVKKFMGKKPYVLTPEISLENAFITYEGITVDSLGEKTSPYYNIHKKGSLSNIVRTEKFGKYEHYYHDNLEYCTGKLHFHLECRAEDYKDFQKNTKSLRKFTTHNLYMCKSGSSMDTAVKVEKTANYVTKLNLIAPASSVRNGRFKFDVPVYDKKSAYMRMQWLKLTKPVTNIENTDKQALKDISHINHVQNKKKEELQAKVARRVEKIEKQKGLDAANKHLTRIYTKSPHNRISKSNRALFIAVNIKNKTEANKKQQEFSGYSEDTPKQWTSYNMYAPIVSFKGSGPPSVSAV